jgi:hypothetical protein
LSIDRSTGNAFIPAPTMLRLALTLPLVVLILVVVTACGRDATDGRVADDDALRRYHDGERWLTVRVALDRLLLERSLPGQAAQSEVYLVRTPLASVAQLEDLGRQLRAAQPDLSGISAYVQPLDAPNTPPARLLRRFSLRTTPGADAAAIAARAGARVVDTVPGVPDAVVCEPSSPDLLAGLTAAAAVTGTAGVVAATPLIERTHSRR